MAFPVSTRATDELITAAIWNADLVTNLNAIDHPLATKTADESVTSSTVLQNDDHLFFAMAANETWYVRCGLWVTDGSGSAANFKVAFTVPAGATLGFLGQDTVAQFFWTASGGAQILDTVGGHGLLYQPFGIVVTSATPGNFQVQWAQGTTNAAALTMKAGSFLQGRRLLP